MANRNFPAARVFGFHLMPVHLDGSISIGSTGAVSSFSAKGISSIVRNSAGNYTITMQDPYASLLQLHTFMTQVSGSADSGIEKIELVSAAPSTAGGGKVTIQCWQAQVPSATTQGTPIQYAKADPASGSTLNFALLLNNSNVQ